MRTIGKLKRRQNGCPLSMLGISTSQHCPKCQHPMEAGEFLVQSGPRGRLLLGPAREHLWFSPFNRPVELALKSKSRRTGFRCSRCGLLLINGAAAGG